jgi:hypothetical protein
MESILIFSILYIGCYYILTPIGKKSKDYGKNLNSFIKNDSGKRLLMSIGALLLPVSIMLLTDGLFFLLSGGLVEKIGNGEDQSYWKYGDFAMIIWAIVNPFCLVLFMGYYDKGQRGLFGDVVFILACFGLWLVNAFTMMFAFSGGHIYNY